MQLVRYSVCTLLFLHFIGISPIKAEFAFAKSQKETFSGETLAAGEVEKLKSEIAKSLSGDSLGERVTLAQHYSAVHEYKMVITYLRPVSEKLDISGMRMLANAYSAENEHLQAIRILQHLVEKNKNDYVSHYRLGKSYFKSDKLSESIASFTAAIKINERFREAYDELLIALEKAERRYDLRETLIDMVATFGETGKLLSDLCKIYYEDGFLTESSTLCQKAITKAPEVAENHIFLGLTFLDSENKDRAIAIVDTAAKRFTKSEFAQYTAGQLNEDGKNPATAYLFFKKGTEADPKSFRCWLGLAKTAFETKNYAEALGAFKQACILNRSNTVEEFRSASGKLKSQRENDSWSIKFNSESLKCRYSAGG